MRKSWRTRAGMWAVISTLGLRAEGVDVERSMTSGGAMVTGAGPAGAAVLF